MVPFGWLRFESGELASRIVPLDRPEITVGRLPTCDILLDEPRVSREHAAFTFEDGRAGLRDMGSQNGTFCNGKRVSGATALRDGDIVVIGSVRARFYREHPGATARPPLVAAGRVGGGPAVVPVAGGSPHATLIELRGAHPGRTYTLGPNTRIGRHPARPVIIEEASVSRTHAVIEWDGARYVLTDQGSHNGTLVNGVRANDPIRLAGGERITIGETVLLFAIEREA